MRYAKVDRSDFEPNFGGRPYRLECWSLAGTTGVTVLMPDAGIEAHSAVEVNAALCRRACAAAAVRAR